MQHFILSRSTRKKGSSYPNRITHATFSTQKYNHKKSHTCCCHSFSTRFGAIMPLLVLGGTSGGWFLSSFFFAFEREPFFLVGTGFCRHSWVTGFQIVGLAFVAMGYWVDACSCWKQGRGGGFLQLWKIWHGEGGIKGVDSMRRTKED